MHIKPLGDIRLKVRWGALANTGKYSPTPRARTGSRQNAGASGYTGQGGQCVQRVWTISLRMFPCRCKILGIGHAAPEEAEAFCC